MMNMNNFLLLLVVCFMYIVAAVGIYAMLCHSMILKLCVVAVGTIILVLCTYYITKIDKED